MPTTIHIPRAASPFGSRVPIGLNGRVSYIPTGEDYVASDAEVAALQALNIQTQQFLTTVPDGFILLSQRTYGSRVPVTINGRLDFLPTGVPFQPDASQLGALIAAGRTYRSGGSTPVFTLLPTIVGSPQVGVAMVFSDGVPPLGYLATKRELVDATTGTVLASADAPTALAYTPVSADANRPVFFRLTVALLGATVTVSSDAKTIAVFSGRRTNEFVTYGFGRQTASGIGGVPLANPELGLLKTGAEAPTSWTIAAPSPGTPAHWTTGARTSTPVPSATGAANFLPDTQAVFQVTAAFADGSTEVSTITANVLPDVFTLGQADNFNAVPTTYGARVDGKTIEIAAGADYLGVAVQPTGKLIATWRFTNPTIFRAHDTARVRWPAAWLARSCSNVTFNDLMTSDSDGTNVVSRFQIGLDGSGNLASAVTVNRFRHFGTRTYYYVNTTTADQNKSKPLFSIGGNATVTLNDCDGEFVRAGCAGSNNNPAGTVTNVTVNRMRIRHFWDNADITGTGDGTEIWTFNDCRWIAPDRLDVRGVATSNHADAFQMNAQNRNCVATFNRCWSIQADGDGLAQGIFGTLAANVTSGAHANTYNINGLVIAGTITAAVGVSESKASTMRNITTVLQRPVVPLRDTTIDVMPGANNNSFTARTDQNQGAAGYQGPNALLRSIFYGQVSNGGVFDTSDGVTALGGTLNGLPDYSNHFASNPTMLLEAFDWANATWAQIEARVRSALAPKVNGALKRGDGSYNGAFNPDGTDATNAAP